MKTSYRKNVLALSITIAIASPNLTAAPSDTPLFLSTLAKPAIIFGFDDSGSMDGEVSFGTNDGAAWWNTSNMQFVGLGLGDVASPGTLNFNNAGTASPTWKKYVYLFPNGTGTGARAYGDSTNDHYAIPPTDINAWARSPAYNKFYFNPEETYTPWRSYGSVVFPNANPTAAKSTPVGTTPTMNLLSDVQLDTSNNTFKMHQGMVIPTGVTYKKTGCSTSSENNSGWLTATADVPVASTCNVGIRYFPATYYLPAGTVDPSGNTPVLTRVGKTPADPAGPCPANCSLDKYEIKSGQFGTTAQYDAAKKNFANWFTYYRKRDLASRGAFGKSFGDVTNVRVGTFKINSRPATLTMYDMATQRNTVLGNVYGYEGSGGTPLRESLDYIGGQFKRTGAGAPVLYACQKNFAVLLTDGFANSGGGSGGNVDGSYGSPYADSVGDTMGDVAMNYYVNNIRPDLTPGLVPTDKYDSNKDPHMVTYGLGINLSGIVYGVDAAATADPFANPPTWPTSFPSRHPSAVDDLWHATINGRGLMLNAGSPEDVATKMKAAMSDIQNRSGSAASVATNSSSLADYSRVYQAKFHTSGWAGQLVSLKINADGSINPNEDWDAGTKINGQSTSTTDSRVVLTKISTGGTPFHYGNLDAWQKDYLDKDYLNTIDNRGDERVRWLRGQSSAEGGGTDDLRIRSRSKLGDIVNSSPAYVGGPSGGYSDVDHPGYASFFAANKDRDHVVYVGANDGMLHGFKSKLTFTDPLIPEGVATSDSGTEVLAYVPTQAYSKLSALTHNDYETNHKYFVDSSPMVGDVCVNNCDASGATWRTMLIGGLGAGGKGFFALDVTSPANFTEGNAGNIVKWEFTDADDVDMGMSFNMPSLNISNRTHKQLVKMENGKWAVIVGNGYYSANGKAALYIMFLENGEDGSWSSTDYMKIVANAGPNNGLSTPTPFDTDGNGKADVIFAGDLQGNLWKFDVSNPVASAANWKVAFSGVPLFVAKDASSVRQPIVTPPAVSRLWGWTAVMFGTGKYIETGDATSVTPQTFYMVTDTGPTTISGRVKLKPITVSTFTSSGNEYRQVTTPNYSIWSFRGWYLDLPTSGERVVGTPYIINGIVYYNTLIPSSAVCSTSTGGWLMAHNYSNGLYDTSSNRFDTNGDGLIDLNDSQALGFKIGAAPGGSALIKPKTGTSTGLAVSSLTDTTIGSAKVHFGKIASGRIKWREVIQ